VARDPGRATAWRALAGLSLDAGDLDDARAHLDRARALTPGDPATAHLSGVLAEAAGDPTAALSAYERAYRAQHRPPELIRAYAAALFKAGRHADALSVLAATDDLDLIALRAECEQAVGAWASAEDDLWRLVRSPRHRLQALESIVARRLETRDVVGLSRLWEEVHHRLDPSAKEWQALTEGDYDRLAIDLHSGEPTPRLRAALGACVYRFEGAQTLLRQLASSDDPLLREASWASRLTVDRIEFAAWCRHAAEEEAGGGALQALTLLEFAHRLRPEHVPSLRLLAKAKGALLRRALPLAGAVALTRAEGIGAEDGVGVDAGTKGALQILSGGGDSDPASVLLALRLLDVPDNRMRGWSELRAHVQRQLDTILEGAPSPDLLAARARLRLESGDHAEAQRDVEASLTTDTGHVESLELLHAILSLRGDSARDAVLERLRSRDRVAAEQAMGRAAFAKEFGLLVLRGPNSGVVAVFEPRPPGMDSAFVRFGDELAVTAGGLETRGHATLLSRFGFSEFQSVDYVGDHRPPAGKPVACTTTVVLHPASGDRNGRAFVTGSEFCKFFVDHLEVHLFDLCDEPVQPDEPVQIVVRRGFSTVYTPGRTLGSIRTRPRSLPGTHQLRMAHGWADGTHKFVRVTICGRPSGRLAQLPAVPPPPRYVPLDGAEPLETKGEIANAPKTLDALRRDGARILARGIWVGRGEKQRLLYVPKLSGNFVLRARVRFSPESKKNKYSRAGIALRSVPKRVHLGVKTRLYFVVGEPRQWDPDNVQIMVRWQRGQRGERWETPVAATGWPPDTPVVLSLERRGDYVLASYGKSVANLRPLFDEPLYFPLKAPVDACLLGTSMDRVGTRFATFDRVEVLVEAD
jgi:tetratricopeptide (TPR) repeat protein